MRSFQIMASTKFYIGVDVGTASVRAGLVSDEGKVRQAIFQLSAYDYMFVASLCHCDQWVVFSQVANQAVKEVTLVNRRPDQYLQSSQEVK